MNRGAAQAQPQASHRAKRSHAHSHHHAPALCMRARVASTRGATEHEAEQQPLGEVRRRTAAAKFG